MTSGDRNKRIVFHVGAHKTGTTLIQDYLGQQVGALRAQRILHVPRARMARYVGWGDALLNNPAAYRKMITEFEHSDDYDQLLMSHEDTLGHPFHPGRDGSLYPDARRNLTALHDLHGGLPTTIVIFLRRQHDFVASYYLQSVQEGGWRPYTDWAAARVDPDKLSWLPVVDAARDLFGAHQVELVDFDLIRQGENAYIRRFCQLAAPHLTVDPHYRPSRSNRSISQKGLDLALAANRYLRTVTERREMTDFLQRYFSNADYPKAEPVDPAEFDRLRATYTAEYEELVRFDDAGRASADPLPSR